MQEGLTTKHTKATKVRVVIFFTGRMFVAFLHIGLKVRASCTRKNLRHSAVLHQRYKFNSCAQRTFPKTFVSFAPSW